MEERELAHEVAARLDMDEGMVAEVVREVLDVMGAGEGDTGLLGKGAGYGHGGSEEGLDALQRGGGYGYGGSDDSGAIGGGGGSGYGGSGGEPVGGSGYGPGGS